MEILYTNYKTKKKKTFYDGKLVVKNTTIYLYNNDGKSIDSISLSRARDYAQIEFLELPGHICQLEDEHRQMLNRLRIKNYHSAVVLPALAEVGDAQPVGYSPEYETYRTIYTPAEVGDKISVLQDAFHNQAADDYQAHGTSSSRDAAQELVYMLYSNRHQRISSNIPELNELKYYIQMKLKPNSDLIENCIQLLTAEILIQILDNLTRKQNIQRGDIVRYKSNIKFDYITQHGQNSRPAEFILYYTNYITCKYHDLIVIVAGGHLFMTVVKNYVQQDKVEIWLEYLSNCYRLCNLDYMTLQEKQAYFSRLKGKKHINEVSYSIQYMVFNDFYNQYNVIKCMLDEQALRRNKCDRVIYEHCSRIFNKKYVISCRFASYEEEYEYTASIKYILIPVGHECKQKYLNAHQLHALNTITNYIFHNYGSRRLHLLRGIFGAGKTQTICYLIENLYYNTNFNMFKILLISVTNTAIDNILQRLIGNQIVPYNQIQRLGTGCQNEDVAQVVYSTFKPSKFITATTCASCQKLLCEDNAFSLLIIDEASQMKIVELVYLGLNVQTIHIVLCGDPAQLPPIAEYAINQKSVFYWLIEHNFPLSNLFLYYRCNKAIAEISSQLFYGGQVETYREDHYKIILDNVAEYFREQSCKIYQQASEAVHVDQSYPSDAQKLRPRIKIVQKVTICQDTLPNIIPQVALIHVFNAPDNTQQQSRFNCVEADEVVRFLNYIVETQYVMPSKIGVICPYKLQVEALRKRLPECILVSTVDSFQGNEKELVVISLTKSSDVFDCQLNQFLDYGCRVNVAISRAKNHFIIFKSYVGQAMCSQIRKNDGHWSLIMSYCMAINRSYNGVDGFKYYQRAQFNAYKTLYEDGKLSELEQSIKMEHSICLFKLPAARNEQTREIIEYDRDIVHYGNYIRMKKADNRDELAEIYRKYLSMLYCHSADGDPKSGDDWCQHAFVTAPNKERQNESGFEILKVLGYEW